MVVQLSKLIISVHPPRQTGAVQSDLDHPASKLSEVSMQLTESRGGGEWGERQSTKIKSHSLCFKVNCLLWINRVKYLSIIAKL